MQGPVLFRDRSQTELNPEGVKDLLSRTLTNTFKKSITQSNSSADPTISKVTSNHIIADVYRVVASGFSVSDIEECKDPKNPLIAALATMLQASRHTSLYETESLSVLQADIDQLKGFILDLSKELQGMASEIRQISSYDEKKNPSIETLLSITSQATKEDLQRSSLKITSQLDETITNSKAQFAIEQAAAKKNDEERGTVVPLKIGSQPTTKYALDARYQIMNFISDRINDKSPKEQSHTVSTEKGDITFKFTPK